MSLEKNEKDMLKIIDENDLKRKIRHVRIKKEHDKFYDIKINDKTYKNTRALTIVAIGRKEKSITISSIKGNSDIEWLFKKGLLYNIKSLGIAICSKKDQFHRKLGRVIATGRALKRMDLW